MTVALIRAGQTHSGGCNGDSYHPYNNCLNFRGNANVRNMSFMLTTKQIRDRTKTVTRRIGWWNLKPGDRLQACVKCQGIKKGEKIEKLAVIEVVNVRREPLNEIMQEDTYDEGFPILTPDEFVAMFCRNMKCEPRTEVNRIRFKYVD